MARITLTDYEVKHGLLPAVCARCATPAAGRVTQTVGVLDGWRGAFQLIAVLFGLFFFPPLLPFTLRFARLVRVPVPMCPEHAELFRWQERAEKRYLLPAWTVVAVGLDVVFVVELLVAGTGYSFTGVFVVLVGALLAAAVIGHGRVNVAYSAKTGVRLTGVHRAFVAAMVEDRARARVDDPDRRGGHGDVRDDYDDEAN